MKTAGNAKKKKFTVMEIVRRNIHLNDKPIMGISGQATILQVKGSYISLISL